MLSSYISNEKFKSVVVFSIKKNYQKSTRPLKKGNNMIRKDDERDSCSIFFDDGEMIVNGDCPVDVINEILEIKQKTPDLQEISWDKISNKFLRRSYRPLYQKEALQMEAEQQALETKLSSVEQRIQETFIKNITNKDIISILNVALDHVKEGRDRLHQRDVEMQKKLQAPKNNSLSEIEFETKRILNRIDSASKQLGKARLLIK